MNTIDYAANFSHNIRFLRQQHNLSQKDMARILGMGVGMLRRIEHGEMPRRCHAGHLLALSEHFGVATHAVLFQRLDED